MSALWPKNNPQRQHTWSLMVEIMVKVGIEFGNKNWHAIQAAWNSATTEKQDAFMALVLLQTTDAERREVLQKFDIHLKP